MRKEKVLVIGLGEVGEALYELLVESGSFSVYAYDSDIDKMKKTGASKPEGKVDVIHVCIPCYDHEEFVRSVLEYIEKFDPEITIINSTIPPGTTEEIKKKSQHLIAHSPIRGVHKSREYMKWEIRRWTKYIGGTDSKSAEIARKHFEKLGLKVKFLRSSRETELAKIFETTYRAWMIACFQEMHRISRYFSADFDQIVDFLEDTHKMRFDRPPMFPGVIGGHCLIPNVKMLLEAYNSDFLRLILKSNEKRKKEILDDEIKKETEKVKARIKKLEEELAKMKLY
ncbi:GDP-mannose dehydrogenase [Candidatus Bathyarchaeota archaeon]|nr:MAG: GDP-mannose dehydrogenase [Candidatus Bathyarchaeota archaeon]